MVVETDNTFERQMVRGEEAWVGRCIHCQRKLVTGLDGSAAPGVTLEHLVPRHHGGADEARNLALACGGCNAEKGLRYDWRRRDDPRRLELEQTLCARRLARWRDPPPSPYGPSPARGAGPHDPTAGAGQDHEPVRPKGRGR
ncbi:MAG TPA: HNH endonuclease signature motif containing protein [Polyangiaceae bacterium]|nr:HNH endonuclease signature motif containing protein [Polyangiaceae bacterium]